MYRPKPRQAIVFAIAAACASGAHADWILTFTPEIILGDTIVLTDTVKAGTATARLAGPGGPVLQDGPHTVTSGTAKARVELPGGIAGAKANVDTGRASSGWVIREDLLPGWTGAGTAASVTKSVTSTVVTTPTRIILHPTFIRDPHEIDDLYFSPEVNPDARLRFSMQLSESTTGYSFASETTAAPGSPDTLSDNTGLVTWQRTPGVFSGIADAGVGPMGPSSNNRWALQTDMIALSMPVIDLQAGQSLDLDFTFTMSSSGTGGGGPGLIGVSAVPEPSSLALLTAACVAFGFASSDSRRRPRRSLTSRA